MNKLCASAPARSSLACAVFVALSASFALSGCGTVKDAYLVDSVVKAPKSEALADHGIFQSGQWVPQAVDVYGDEKIGKLFSGNDETAYHWIDTGPDDDQKKYRRNRVMGFLTGRSNEICQTHEAGIFADGVASNFVFSEVTTVLSGLGGLFTPAATVRALSSSAAIVNGTRDNFNNSFYQNLLAQAIIDSIETTRATKLTTLNQHKSDSITDFSADDMFAALIDYHASCSFYRGIVALSKTAGRAQLSTDELTARIDLLKKQRDENTTQAGLTTTSASDKVQLNAQNGQLTAQIGLLQAQLAAAGGPPTTGTK